MLMVLAPAGILAGLKGIMRMYSIDQEPIRHLNLAENVHYQGLWLVQPVSRDRDLCHHQNIGRRGGHSPLNASSCLSNDCLLDDSTAWDEWRTCKTRQLLTQGWAADKAQVAAALEYADVWSITSATAPAAVVSDFPSGFDAFIVQYQDELPWNGSNFTAVLLESRFLEERLVFSINNVLNNLPVNWRIQIVGGGQICNGMRRLYPCEVAAGKIVLTDIGDRPMQQVPAGMT